MTERVLPFGKPGSIYTWLKVYIQSKLQTKSFVSKCLACPLQGCSINGKFLYTVQLRNSLYLSRQHAPISHAQCASQKAILECARRRRASRSVRPHRQSATFRSSMSDSCAAVKPRIRINQNPRSLRCQGKHGYACLFGLYSFFMAAAAALSRGATATAASAAARTRVRAMFLCRRENLPDWLFLSSGFGQKGLDVVFLTTGSEHDQQYGLDDPRECNDEDHRIAFPAKVVSELQEMKNAHEFVRISERKVLKIACAIQTKLLQRQDCLIPIDMIYKRHDSIDLRNILRRFWQNHRFPRRNLSKPPGTKLGAISMKSVPVQQVCRQFHAIRVQRHRTE